MNKQLSDEFIDILSNKDTPKYETFEVDLSEAEFRNSINKFDANDEDLLSNHIKNDIHSVECLAGCPYYYGEGDICMEGEDGVPDNLVKKCSQTKGSTE